jgi:regulator of sigma E protease
VETGCLGKEGNHNVDWYLVAESSGLLSVVWSYVWVIGSVAVTLGFVIFVHELGHFLAAKACGVKCEKFYIGFDVPMSIGPLKLPAALCRFRWGETEYGIGSLPLGGYVKMLGQDDNPSAQARENERIRIPKTTSGGPATDVRNASESSTDSAVSAVQAIGDTDPATGTAEEGFELDPRSYPAKPVWQRMIIISAGVVMNLIFAVVFAALAYTMGVRYVPCIIGETIADSPAWREGIQPEDQVLQIDRRWQPDEHLRFRRDLMPQVLLNGGRQPMELLLRPRGASQADWMTIQPENRLRAVKQAFSADPLSPDDQVRAQIREQVLGLLPPVASLGITSVKTTQLSPLAPVEMHCLDESAFEELRSGDEIVAVDGVALSRDEQTGSVFSTQFEAMLAAQMTEPVTLTVQRTAADQSVNAESARPLEFDVVLPPRRMRDLGMTMRAGPIAAVRPGTPAALAGLRQGDRLLAIAGQELGDPLTLAQRLLEHVGQEIEIQYERGGQEQSLRLIPQAPQTLGESLFYGSLLSIEGLGIALPVHNTVAWVRPGGPADRAGVQPGDEILTFRMELEDEAKLEQVKELFPAYDRTVYLDRAVPTWQYVHSAFLQRALPGTKIHLSLLRDSPEPIKVTMLPEESDQWFNSSRGLLLTGLTQVRTASTWSDAWRLGFRETWDSVTQVTHVLRGLLTGRVSWRNLGGPITIATVAGYEASEGLSQLLIFLTLLSANLAVLNFLPIPALDGGHMVFLAAEGIRGKPVDERLQVVLTIVGVAFLLGLILVLSIKDIGNLLQLFG